MHVNKDGILLHERGLSESSFLFFFLLWFRKSLEKTSKKLGKTSKLKSGSGIPGYSLGGIDRDLENENSIPTEGQKSGDRIGMEFRFCGIKKW